MLVNVPEQLSLLLRETIERELPQLRAVTDSASSVCPKGPGSWSPKEELGHLIDSAANNHIRFVRAALDGVYRGPGYAQNDWVAIHGYQEMPWDAIIALWLAYNSLIAGLVSNIPENNLSADCFVGSSEAPVTLRFLIADYVRHMRHHLDHLLQRQSITEYPAPPDMKADAKSV